MKKQHRYEKIGGWFNFQDIYADMVEAATDGAHFVEIGTCLGKSASFMGIEIYNSGKEITFDTIDTFQGSPAELNGKHKFFKTVNVYDRAKAALKDLPVNIIVGDSVEVAQNYKDASLDFVFIDGAHTYDAVVADIKAWLPKVKPGGIIAGHDYDQTGVSRAVDSIFDWDCSASVNSWLVQKNDNDRIYFLEVC